MSQKLFITIEEIFRTSITNNTIKVRGWIYRTRSSGNIVFIMLRDSTGYLQATIKKDNIGEKEFKDAKKSLVESSVELEGVIKEDKRAPGGYELQTLDFKIIQFAEPFPIVEDQSPEFLLDKRHLWIRSQKLT